MNRAVVIICGLLAMAAISHVTMRFAHGQVLLQPGDTQEHLTPRDLAAVASFYQQARSSTVAPTQAPKN